MAQLTTNGRLKLLCSSEGLGVSSRSDPRDPFHFKLLSNGGSGSVQLHKRRFKLLGSSRLYSSSASASSRSTDRIKDFDSEVVFEGNDVDFETDELSYFRGLVLDLSYRPVNIVCWKRAICLEFMEKADVLEYYEKTVNSPSGSFYIPAVLRVQQLLRVVKRKKLSRVVSRREILQRDHYTCQYCSSVEGLTIDHIIPVSRGGGWNWENLVAACFKCNCKKGNKTLEEVNMELIKTPKAPKEGFDVYTIPLTKDALKRVKARNGTPQEWRQYLP